MSKEIGTMIRVRLNATDSSVATTANVHIKNLQPDQPAPAEGPLHPAQPTTPMDLPTSDRHRHRTPPVSEIPAPPPPTPVSVPMVATVDVSTSTEDLFPAAPDVPSPVLHVQAVSISTQTIHPLNTRKRIDVPSISPLDTARVCSCYGQGGGNYIECKLESICKGNRFYHISCVGIGDEEHMATAIAKKFTCPNCLQHLVEGTAALAQSMPVAFKPIPGGIRPHVVYSPEHPSSHPLMPVLQQYSTAWHMSHENSPRIGLADSHTAYSSPLSYSAPASSSSGSVLSRIKNSMRRHKVGTNTFPKALLPALFSDTRGGPATSCLSSSSHEATRPESNGLKSSTRMDCNLGGSADAVAVDTSSPPEGPMETLSPGESKAGDGLSSTDTKTSMDDTRSEKGLRTSSCSGHSSSRSNSSGQNCTTAHSSETAHVPNRQRKESIPRPCERQDYTSIQPLPPCPKIAIFGVGLASGAMSSGLLSSAPSEEPLQKRPRVE